MPPSARTVARGRSRETHSIRGAPPSTLGVYAQQLATALVGRQRDRALAVLVRAGDEGWELREVENQIIVPAITRIGHLWLQGRLDDVSFGLAGALAEAVEHSFRCTLC